jgi:hypothetical protein
MRHQSSNLGFKLWCAGGAIVLLTIQPKVLKGYSWAMTGYLKLSRQPIISKERVIVDYQVRLKNGQC